MWQKAFAFWLVLLPFIVWRGVFEGAKIVWFWSGSIVLIFFWLIKLRGKIKFSTSDYLYLSWLVVLILASLTGIHPLDSIIGGSYRHQSVIFFFALFLVGKTLQLLDTKHRKTLILGIFAAVSLQAILTIFQKLLEGHIPLLLTVNGRPIGTFGEPNAAAGFITIGSIIALSSLFNIVNNKLLLATSILALVAVILTQSRTSLIMLAFVTITFAVLTIRKKLSHKLLYTFVVPLSLVILIIVANLSISRPSSLFENRIQYWKLSVNAISAKPILGFGAESTEKVLEEEYAKIALPLEGLIIDRSHNLLFDLAIWSGLLGLILFISWFFSEVRELISRNKILSLVVVLSWLIFSFLQPLGVVHWVFLMFILRLT